MSIFGKIKSAIFGEGGPFSHGYVGNAHPGADKPATAQPSAAPEPHVTPTVESGAGGHNRNTPHPQTIGNEPLPEPAAAQPEPVDVEAVLEEKARHNGQQLNWRSSIVDLLKLLGIDSSLEARKELAEELGYTGAKDGSAEMNIWLHKAVMRALEQNGGKVPANLKD